MRRVFRDALLFARCYEAYTMFDYAAIAIHEALPLLRCAHASFLRCYAVLPRCCVLRTDAATLIFFTPLRHAITLSYAAAADA